MGVVPMMKFHVKLALCLILPICASCAKMVVTKTGLPNSSTEKKIQAQTNSIDENNEEVANETVLTTSNTNNQGEPKSNTASSPKFGVHYPASLIAVSLNKVGLSAISAKWSEREPFFCSRFAKQIFQNTFKDHARYIGEKLFGFSAYDTERLWKKEGFLLSLKAAKEKGGLSEGDVLFQDYPVWGHVGVLIKKNNEFFVAENTVRYGFRMKDYRALTPLSKFGKIRSVGRISNL